MNDTELLDIDWTLIEDAPDPELLDIDWDAFELPEPEEILID